MTTKQPFGGKYQTQGTNSFLEKKIRELNSGKHGALKLEKQNSIQHDDCALTISNGDSPTPFYDPQASNQSSIRYYQNNNISKPFTPAFGSATPTSAMFKQTKTNPMFNTVATARVFSFGPARTEVVSKDHFTSRKFKIKESSDYLRLDRKINQLKSETPNFPYISPRNLPGTAEKLLRKIKEDAERINDFKEQFSQVNRGLNTRILGGGPLHQIPTNDERERLSLVSDPDILQHKCRQKQRLQTCWNDAYVGLKPYLYDKKISDKCSYDNPPDSSHKKHFNQIVYADHMTDQELNLVECRRNSYFNSKKNSVRGFKKGKLTIEKLQNGGYKNKKVHSPRVTRLEELLSKFDDVREARDKYENQDRQNEIYRTMQTNMITLDDQAEIKVKDERQKAVKNLFYHSSSYFNRQKLSHLSRNDDSRYNNNTEQNKHSYKTPRATTKVSDMSMLARTLNMSSGQRFDSICDMNVDYIREQDIKSQTKFLPYPTNLTNFSIPRF